MRVVQRFYFLRTSIATQNNHQCSFEMTNVSVRKMTRSSSFCQKNTFTTNFCPPLSSTSKLRFAHCNLQFANCTLQAASRNKLQRESEIRLTILYKLQELLYNLQELAMFANKKAPPKRTFLKLTP